jgi:hypothetical protein
MRKLIAFIFRVLLLVLVSGQFAVNFFSNLNIYRHPSWVKNFVYFRFSVLPFAPFIPLGPLSPSSFPLFRALGPLPVIFCRKGSISMRPRNVHRKNVHTINTGIGFSANAKSKNYVGSQYAAMDKNGINNSANVEHQSLTSFLDGII